MADLKQFLADLKVQEKKIIDAVEDIEKDVVISVFDSLLDPKRVGGTPKLTGHLRSNYLITTDSKTTDVVGSPEKVDRSQRESHKEDFLNEEDLSKSDKIYINNNVWYGSIVNHTQKFREASIKRGIDNLRRNRKVDI